MGRKLKREFARIRVRIPAILRTEGKNLPGSIFDISEGGVALSTKEAIPTTKMLNIDFALPGRTGMITTSAVVVWNDVSGRFGAQFVEIEPTSRKAVCDWVAAQVSSKRLRRAVGRHS
jgi:c-di-GMP-binding flagellar brake protein YcgR